MQGGRAWYSGFILHLVVQFSSLGLITAGGQGVKGENGYALFPCLWVGNSHPPPFGMPSQMCKQSPLQCSWFPSDPAFTLFSCQRMQNSCFISGTAVFQSPTFQRPTLQTHANPLGEGLAALWLVLACPRKQLCACTALQNLW